MKTYQDLMEVVGDQNRAKFCLDAVAEFKNTPKYIQAVEGEAYYNKHNLTIEAYQKTLSTLSGRKKADTLSANYKLKTLFFRRLVSQQVQYVLGNGLKLTDPKNKEKLGEDFDFQLMNGAKRAMASGVAFGFWNLDHLEIFGYADTPSQPGFCPLYDEQTSKLRAGIRYWFRTVDDEVIFRATLYEEDGFTEFRCVKNQYEVLEEKRSYIRTTRMTPDGAVEDVVDENYSDLPIVPLYANDSHESELVGIKECIDCYDLIKSGLANNIDDASEIYWILKNTGGMDDVDLAQFLFRLKTVKGAVVDGDNGVDVDAHTVQIPVEARQTMLELLRKDIYEDFQALDVNTLSASAKTTQEIQASYQSQDNKCADFEYFITRFVQGILKLAEIDDIPTFTWNRVVNQAEQTQMVLQASNYLTDEAIIKHLPFLTPEEADEIIKERDKEDFDQFNQTEEDDDQEDQNTEEDQEDQEEEDQPEE